jgi:hypothetical protein
MLPAPLGSLSSRLSVDEIEKLSADKNPAISVQCSTQLAAADILPRVVKLNTLSLGPKLLQAVSGVTPQPNSVCFEPLEAMFRAWQF